MRFSETVVATESAATTWGCPPRDEHESQHKHHDQHRTAGRDVAITHMGNRSLPAVDRFGKHNRLGQKRQQFRRRNGGRSKKNNVVRAEFSSRDTIGQAAHRDPIRRLQVLDNPVPRPIKHDPCMMARNRRIFEHQIVVGSPSHAHRRVFA